MELFGFKVTGSVINRSLAGVAAEVLFALVLMGVVWLISAVLFFGKV